MPDKLIDIEKIKSELSIQAVLEKYGIRLRKTENSLVGCCPIHNGDNRNAFHVSLDKNLWNCFTRDHGGDVLNFIMEYENVSFVEAAKIAEEMISSPDFIKLPKSFQEAETTKVNKPLSYILKLEPNHTYLFERGLEKSTIEYFGLGYCNESGTSKGRIAIPIHDENGLLVAYCGRSVSSEEQKYKFPKGFNKSLVVFNLHRLKGLYFTELIIVEGFFDLFKIYQAGFPNVVALMGSSISEEQRDLIMSLGKKLILLLDGDAAGRKGTKQLIKSFKGKLPMIVKHLPEGAQPDTLTEQELKKIPLK